jgi:hypothetical protein
MNVTARSTTAAAKRALRRSSLATLSLAAALSLIAAVVNIGPGPGIAPM